MDGNEDTGNKSEEGDDVKSKNASAPPSREKVEESTEETDNEGQEEKTSITKSVGKLKSMIPKPSLGKMKPWKNSYEREKSLTIDEELSPDEQDIKEEKKSIEKNGSKEEKVLAEQKSEIKQEKVPSLVGEKPIETGSIKEEKPAQKSSILEEKPTQKSSILEEKPIQKIPTKEKVTPEGENLVNKNASVEEKISGKTGRSVEKVMTDDEKSDLRISFKEGPMSKEKVLGEDKVAKSSLELSEPTAKLKSEAQANDLLVPNVDDIKTKNKSSVDLPEIIEAKKHSAGSPKVPHKEENEVPRGSSLAALRAAGGAMVNNAYIPPFASSFLQKRSPFIHNPPRPEERRQRIQAPSTTREYIINLREDLADFQESHGVPRTRDYSFVSLGLALAQETGRAIFSLFQMFTELFPILAIVSLILRFALDKLIEIMETSETVPKIKKSVIFAFEMLAIVIPLWILVGTIILPLLSLMLSIFKRIIRFRGGKKKCSVTKAVKPSSPPPTSPSKTGSCSKKSEIVCPD